MNKIIDEVKLNELNSEIEQEHQRKPQRNRDRSLQKPEPKKFKISTNGQKAGDSSSNNDLNPCLTEIHQLH